MPLVVGKIRGDLMIRILLPLAFVAVIFFGPMYSYSTENPVSGSEEEATISGSKFIGEAVNCVREMKVPIGEECRSTAEINKSTNAANAISWAATLAGGAAALGILGLLPFVGRLTSVVTTLAGLGGIGAMGYFMMAMMGTSEGLPAVSWGAYLAAGAALLTTISGLSGMRGR